ncbi:MAG: cupin domain-containing protein [Gammaproteobacteria bacterium]|jgi:anti-sigma factor ChrR (cupin superfamily)|nr:cupin domain-containing protein [Gammaproteobacteria bacterium]MDX2461610.1 cupin domain-containing protein [Gammaproteobacteria bacterium]
MSQSTKAPVDRESCIAAVMSTTSSYMTTVDTDWEATDSEGFWVKKLYENEQRGERTWLMRVDAGAYSPSHAHEEFEQVYVLEGSFYDDDRLVKAGDYCARSPGAMHSTTSDDGALMLVIYTNA